MKNSKSIVLILIIILIVMSLSSCKGNSDNKDEPSMYYQTKSLGFSDQYYMIRTMTVWQDTIYFLALDKQVDQNNTNWIVNIDSDGNILTEISYQTEGYDSGDNWISGNDIVDMEVDAKGGIWLLIENSRFQYDDYGNLVQEQMEYRIVNLDESGNTLSTYELTKIDDIKDSGEAPLVHNFIIGDNGNFYFLNESASVNSLYIYDDQGNFISQMNGNVSAFSKSKYGQVVAQVAFGSEADEIEIRTIDSTLLKWIDSISVSKYCYSICSGTSYDFLFNDYFSLYGYNIETEEQIEILNWTDCELMNGSIQGLEELSDGRFAAIASDLTNPNEDIVILEKAPSELLPERTILKYATLGISQDIEAKVLEFNKTHTDKKIQILDYSVYDTVSDPYGGINKLNLDIITGEIPDIIDFCGVPIDNFIVNDLLEDLYPYLNKDSDITVDDFLPSIINVLDVEGALYQIPYNFYLVIAAGDSEVVGTKKGWSFDDLYKFMDENEQYQSVFHPAYTQIDFLKYLIRLDPDKLINRTENTCSFDSEEFIKLLEFTKKYFATGDEIVYYNQSQKEPISQDDYPLILDGYYTVEDILMLIDDLNSNANFIGFPVEEGVGNAFVIRANFGITNTSEHKDIAWEFIRGFFLEAYDAGNSFFFPATMSDLEKEVSNTIEQIDLNEDVEYRFKTTATNIQINEQIGLFWELLLSIDREWYLDHSLMEIIIEEANAYFYDDKPVEEVAKIIQDRVQTMLSEQS